MKFKPDKSDYFCTIESSAVFEQKIKGSRFIGHSFPIADKITAIEILEKIRKEHYNATHNCYAFCCGVENEYLKFSDDGEPQGTAGKQILQAINHFELKNVLVIVTRYYGGTKLGVGPLARAYYVTAKESLALASKIQVFRTFKYKISTDYNSITLLKRFFEDFVINISEDYSENVSFITDILQSQSDIFEKTLIEITNGKIKFERI
jgi:uncharacterized YigZ family protein